MVEAMKITAIKTRSATRLEESQRIQIWIKKEEEDTDNANADTSQQEVFATTSSIDSIVKVE